ncbi:hypothetical protein J4H92_11965 [Leucobacter weissii]|uniref:Uncharacterized protein n=1 Tax=Leucobacter weissii TaxID=1983706 RepID=A0A939MQB7_9MICO|nr:hypothetical protein [Leucobacter weissii]MBO1902661.1 hypothetical protein [Leucobacter weissii]
MPSRAGSSSEPFPWTGDVARGDWIAERLDGDRRETDDGVPRIGPALGDLVPAGFDALVRVLHPFRRDRPEGMSWPEWERLADGERAAGRGGELPEIREEPIGWEATAAAHGAEFAPDSLAPGILGLAHDGRPPDGTGSHPSGWRYDLPADGRLDVRALAAVARVLSAHTATPDRGIAAVWEGYGGLVSAQGVGFVVFVPEPEWSAPRWVRRAWARLCGAWGAFQAHRRSFGLRAALRARLLPRWEQPAGSGLLSREAANGPRLELPDRAYVCFEAGVESFADGRWTGRAPWIAPDELAQGAQDAQSPNLVWPEDRAWFLISEIDFDSTLIACSRACADALLAASGVEAAEIDRDTPLWDPLPADE